MDSKKHGNSQTSSEENDQPEKSNDENSGVGRSYECTFCKRGFTNAQALGGHMNIHRKDKAKAKQHTHQQQPSFYNKPNEDHYMNSRYFVPNEFFGAQMNYQFYFPAPNPSYPLSYYQSDFSTAPRSDHLGVNLSLGIGTSHMEDSKGKKRDERGNRMENEVDLELRLGHDP